jgi:hypothetical protein
MESSHKSSKKKRAWWETNLQKKICARLEVVNE